MVVLQFSRGTNDALWAPLAYIQLFIVYDVIMIYQYVLIILMLFLNCFYVLCL